eukprot:TRINITY_DN891_c0_g1_i6.p1 TRINITY_DN891_c0_g1~~TRINITY_DN891_c0_g1_i6.p1  ORF type:complete len:530 (-),score=138.25 TRINITY_DN891_c0_g1_i6:382-1971(-)
MALCRAILIAASGVAAGTSTSEPLCRSRENQGTYLLQKQQRVQRNEALTMQAPGSEVTSDLPDTIYFDAIVRDFKESHPDFQAFDGHSEGLVESELGLDKKPVYHGGLQLSNKTNFDQWYRDTPGVNKKVNFKMVMNKTDKGTYVHESDNFFPVDGKGWGDSAIALDGQLHNFYFTLEMQTTFRYRGGEVFTFKGDDDVWVFVNRKLVIDIGGVHDPIEKSVDIDSLNLTKGAATELRFFFAERRCCGSKFRIETSIMPSAATCTIWGDPHLDVFDSGLFGAEKEAPVDIFSSGNYWMVKSEDVHIQARYGTTQYTVDGQSALLALAVGGPFLNGHKLIIRPMEDGGKVTWDSEEILSEFPSEFLLKGFVRINFKEGKKHIDKVLAGYPVKLLTAYMPNNVQLIVNRWPKHIDAVIRMPQQQGGQDGHCGNYNLDPSDDTRDQIFERTGGQVSPDESLFEKAMGSGAGIAPLRTHTLGDCDPQVRSEATKVCEATGQKSHLLEACIFDVCFAGKDFAASDALAFESEKE